MLEIQTEKEFMKNELAEEVRMFFPETEQAKVSVQHTAFCENIPRHRQQHQRKHR